MARAAVSLILRFRRQGACSSELIKDVPIPPPETPAMWSWIRTLLNPTRRPARKWNRKPDVCKRGGRFDTRLVPAARLVLQALEARDVPAVTLLHNNVPTNTYDGLAAIQQAIDAAQAGDTIQVATDLNNP